MNQEKTIYVYADYAPHREMLMGRLYVSQTRGKEVFSFEYDSEWLRQGKSMAFDPDLQLQRGRQYLNNDKAIFGMFSDSCPDRWGRLLMNRREAIRARKEGVRPKKLLESDYLLGVYDKARMGGLRFKLEENGDYLSKDDGLATPPWTSLRELEHASAEFEQGQDGLGEKWLRQLLAPGSSLGGARPKASVTAPDGSLWIAKFPSRHDENDTGAWEMVTHDLAALCGLNVPEAKVMRFSKLGSTYLVKRFDRKKDERIHFSSAMSLLGKIDGDGQASGHGYLELVSFLKAKGANPKRDIQELWRRIVFSMAVSNTDDHFRNHGCLLSDFGWELSPMFDVNPDMYGEYLSLLVDNEDSRIDFDLAISAAEYYEVSEKEAREIVENTRRIVRENWRALAKKYDIKNGEMERMASAFHESASV